ncbi:hypothetical protein M514_11500 [Trichuris suis]|uniref:RING-type E3 ubiquitin transferase n=1 Tax=Trichuris suis TaxID=68888 RepID=A0A085LRP1_9BILA|nr:hypothetical protein M513_11500 [Trichuris suis]KFD72309.1 hypothetical protein M514_11500 [Trichuris suis]KHJ49313.1 zinc finger, ZZ type [Trichuris suis]
MSRSDVHEGVSCDSCGRENFAGRRMKCLKCFDFDLCETCYNEGFSTERHPADHPMQCILTRDDYDLIFGGDGAENPYMPRSFTCPYCGDMGHTENTLCDHVLQEHGEAGCAVMCPICASIQSGDTNLMTEDLVAHIGTEHTRLEFIQPEEARPSRRSGSSRGGHFRSSRRLGHQSAQQNNATRDGDPIAGLMSELISHLGGLRRAGTALTSTMTHIQQLQQQINRQAPSKRTASVTESAPSNGLTPPEPPKSIYKSPIVSCEEGASTWCDFFASEEENKKSFMLRDAEEDSIGQRLIEMNRRFNLCATARLICSSLGFCVEEDDGTSSTKTSVYARGLRKYKSEGDLCPGPFD